MERKFKTLIQKKDRAVSSGNDYVVGRIHGMMSVICRSGNRDYANALSHSYCTIRRDRNGVTLTTLATEEEYDEFKKVVEGYYPELCVFDYQNEES